MSLSMETPWQSGIVDSVNVRDLSSISAILPKRDNDSEAALKESQNNFDRLYDRLVRKSLYF